MKKLLWLIIICGVCYGLGVYLDYSMSDAGVFNPTSTWGILFLVLGGGLYLIYILNKSLNPKKEGKANVSAKDKEGKSTEQYFNARWVTEKELRTDKSFIFSTWESLPSIGDGPLLRSEVKGKGVLEVNMSSEPMHTLIIGTTGTGKTQKYILPSIQVLSSTKNKPSFVVSDPKGELYKTSRHKLEKEGYDVKVFNLREPYASTKWNPMENVYEMYHKAQNVYDEVKTHVDVNPADLGLRIIAREYNNEWYEFEGVAYPNRQMLESDLLAKKAEYTDRAENDLKEIAAALCPIEGKGAGGGDTSWDRGAQEFIQGTMLAMLEDSLDNTLGMTKEKYNFYNLAKIVNYKDQDKKDDMQYDSLRKYFQGRDRFSKVPQLTNTAINNAATTTRNFMGIITSRMSLFNDNGMCFATSGNEMNFDTFADKPTALFIVIPDEKESRHPIATLMISQLYQKLVDLATRYKNERLPRRVYFFLDEFANLPKIEKIGSMITVSRSRNIFFTLVIQSLSQLNTKYGDDVAKTIRGNTPIKIFLGTDDLETCKEFSELCGNKTIEITSVTENSQKDENKKDSTSKSTSKSIASAPLISPNELTLIGEANGTGDMIVKILNQFPIRTKSDPYWKTPMFDHESMPDEYTISRALDEEAIAYSIVDRNKEKIRPFNSLPPRPSNF